MTRACAEVYRELGFVAVAGVAQMAAHEVGDREPGDRVDADAVLAALDCQGLREHRDGSFGRGVDADPAAGV